MIIPSKTYRASITISSFDVGASGCLEASALMRHFQEVASHHADELKVGFNDLKQDNIFWVLTLATATHNIFAPSFTQKTKNPVAKHASLFYKTATPDEFSSGVAVL
jgi:hypothetical protein